jgi:hypothetical protein
LVESVLKMIQPAGAASAKVAPSSPSIVEPKTVGAREPVAVAPPPQVNPLPALRMERASAKFLQTWRVR